MSEEEELELATAIIRMNLSILEIESLQENLEAELAATMLIMKTNAVEIEELEEEIISHKHREPYGTVIHYESNVSTFHPHPGDVPDFPNAIDKKKVYLR